MEETDQDQVDSVETVVETDQDQEASIEILVAVEVLVVETDQEEVSEETEADQATKVLEKMIQVIKKE